MTQSEAFLKAYKNFEHAVSSIGFGNVLAYENCLAEKETNSGTHSTNLSNIRFCRQCRNFLAHEAQDFFIPDKKMTDFLNEEAGKILNSCTVVKKKMNKNLILVGSKFQAAMDIIAKYNKTTDFIPVFDKNRELAGYISTESIYSFLAKNNVSSRTSIDDIVSIPKSRVRIASMFSYIDPNTPIRELKNGSVYIVIDDDKKVLGWY